MPVMRARLLTVALPPLDGPGEPNLERGLGRPAKLRPRAGRVHRSPGLAVRLRRIPSEAALISHQPADQRHQIADADLVRAAQVQRLGTLIALRRGEDPFGSVLDVEELAGGRAVA